MDELLSGAYLLPIGLAVLAVVTVAWAWVMRLRVDDLDLQRKSRMFSSAERNFFDCLMPALSDDFYVFPKMPILDVVAASPSAGSLDKKRIAKHLKDQVLDYVLCKKDDLSIFGVIELENFDSKLRRRQRDQREEMLNEICKAAHLRLFYFDLRQDYQHVDIRRLVTGHSSKPKEPEVVGVARSQFTIDNSSYAAFAKQRTCPQCNGEVVTKVAVKGKRIGEKFLMCRKYPYCDYRVAMSDKMIVEQIKKESRKEADNVVRPGFSDWSAG